MRLVHFFGSIVFGLLVTNIIWLFLVLNETIDQDRAIFTLVFGGPQNQTYSNHSLAANDYSEPETPSFQVTQGMVMLWVVGGLMHAIYDNTIWYLTACICCLPGRRMEVLFGLKKYVYVFIALFIVFIAAVSSFCVLVRAALADNAFKEEGLNVTLHDVDPLEGLENRTRFRFVMSYLIQMTLALFVWNPLVGTILFSGMCGCGVIPILGGRPYEVLQEQRRHERMERLRRKEAERRSAQRRSAQRRM